MRLIYIYIKRFRNIADQEIYLSNKYIVDYDPALPFPDALRIKERGSDPVAEFIYRDSKLSDVHLVVGKTGAGKTNFFQLIGMPEDERTRRSENTGSYFLLYEASQGFVIEPFDIPLSDGLKPETVPDPDAERLPSYIVEYRRILDSMEMLRFRLDGTGRPVDAAPVTLDELEQSGDLTYIFNGFDRNSFSECPYREERIDLVGGPASWQPRELAEFHRTALLCSCRFLKEYIDTFAADSVKRKAALVIRWDNWSDTIMQHLDARLEAHDYWTFTGDTRQEEEDRLLGRPSKRYKRPSVKRQFIHDLWTDYALYLRKWISYIQMFQDDDSEDAADGEAEWREFLDYYFEKEEEAKKKKKKKKKRRDRPDIDPAVLPDFEDISVLQRIKWLCMFIDRLSGYPEGILWQLYDDIKDIGNLLDRFDDRYFTASAFTLPIEEMYTDKNKKLVEDLFERMEQYHPDDAGIFTKELLPYRFSCISAGEYQFAKVLGGLEEYCVRLSVGTYGNRPNLIYLLDEPEMYMHPELCRTFLSRLDTVLKERSAATHIQILISTHSPFLLSDILPGQITRLDVDERGYCVIKNLTEKAYFGANIHTILSDGFFLDYTIGEFARQFLQAKLDWLKSLPPKGDIAPDDEKQIEDLRRIVPQIGDPVIRQSFETLLKIVGGTS